MIAPTGRLDVLAAATNGTRSNGQAATVSDASLQYARFQSDAPAGDRCGAITVRSGSCYACRVCGATNGCG